HVLDAPPESSGLDHVFPPGDVAPGILQPDAIAVFVEALDDVISLPVPILTQGDDRQGGGLLQDLEGVVALAVLIINVVILILGDFLFVLVQLHSVAGPGGGCRHPTGIPNLAGRLMYADPTSRLGGP